MKPRVVRWKRKSDSKEKKKKIQTKPTITKSKGNAKIKIPCDINDSCLATDDPEWYAAYDQELEKFMMSQADPNDPEFKVQSEWFFQMFFPVIKDKCPQFAGYELVEHMATLGILHSGGWVHMNFKAKRKDAEDSSAVIFFAEVTMDRVTCLTQLDIDFSSDTRPYMQCRYCHADDEAMDHPFFPVSGGGCVYHPIDGGFLVGAPSKRK